MSIPGATVFETLKQALARGQAEAAAAREEAKRIDEEMTALANQRSEAVLQLARLSLPDLTRTTVESGFAEVRHDLLTIVERKERRAREVGERLQRLKAAAAEARGKWQAAQSAHQQALARQAELQAALAKTLEQDPEFQALSRQALASEAELKRDEERIVEISKEAKDKLPAYEQSRLFRYLREQRYGTAEYVGRGLARRLDRWISRMIEFDKASRSYRFLLTTPGLMDAEAAKRKAEFHGLMQKIEDLEQGAAERLKISEAVKAVESAAKELERLDAVRVDAEGRAASVEQELVALDQEQGRFYEEALSRLKTFLVKAESGLLERRAAATPDPADDEVVLRIRVLGDEIAAMQPRLARQQAVSQESARVSEGLAHLTRRFEQANFNESRSLFHDQYDLSRSVELFRSGVLTRDAFWDEIKRHQERVPTEFEKKASESVTKAMNSPLTGALVEAMLG
ncbi:MAG TPA: hypothetical protein VM452_19205, partial [Caulifigura sp.]|nr:hypothetical protein [Caulifigura sp.]